MFLSKSKRLRQNAKRRQYCAVAEFACLERRILEKSKTSRGRI